MTKKLLLMIMVVVFALEASVGVEAAYDGEKAAEYAEEYADDRNWNYPSYSSDCTNFVSQCLYAGGLRNKTDIDYSEAYYGVNNEKSDWYCRKYTYFRLTLLGMKYRTDWKVSTTWVRVYNTGSGRGLYQYLVNERGCHIAAFSKSFYLTKFENIVKTAEVGDVIQCGSSGDNLTHSVIVTGKTADDLIVCYHSKNQTNVSYKEYVWPNYSVFYVIKVK